MGGICGITDFVLKNDCQRKGNKNGKIIRDS